MDNSLLKKDVYEMHYPEIRKIILHGLLYEQLKYAVRRSVIIVMMDAIKRSNPTHYADEDNFLKAYTEIARTHVSDMALDGFEIILNKIGDGSLKDGIYQFIDRINTISFRCGSTYSITGKIHE